MSVAALALVLAIESRPPTLRTVPASRDEDERIARARGGDRQAFDELYRRHAIEVHRRLSRLIGPDHEREDLVQQIFIDVYRGLPGFRGDSAFSTWLYRIVVHVAYEHLRKRKKRAIDPAEFDEAVLPGSLETPEALTRRREDLARALGFLARIHPKKRIAFVLREVEGLSLDEIGAIVGAKAPAVGQRVKHAQREIAAMIARDEKRFEREAR